MTDLRTLLESKKFFRIPLRKLETGHFKLTIRINGIRGEFILDTGASTSCIGLDSVTHFGLNSEASEIKASGAGATNMETRIARDNDLTVGGRSLRNVDFILFDLYHINEALTQVNELPVQGILGADLLKKLRAVIDYGRNVLYVK